MLEGAFTILATDCRQPGIVVGARHDSPLVVGLGEGENFLGSDVAAFVAYTKRAMEIDQDQAVMVSADKVVVSDFMGNIVVDPKTYTVDWDASAAEKGGWDSFMDKEIHEGPAAVQRTLLGRLGKDGNLNLDEVRIDEHDFKAIDKIIVIACGTAAYAGMVFLQVLVAIIPGEPLEIAGGYAFGAVWGTVLCLLGSILGSVTVFAVVRKWGIPLVEVFFPREKLEKLSFLRTSPKRTALLWLVFTVPGTPKDLLCYFAGLTDLSWSSWLLIASVGRIPSIVTSTVGGDALGMQNYQFAVVGLLIYRQVCRRHDAHRGSANSDT